MLSQLRQHYYWPGMRKDIQLWCISCPQCQTSKGPPARAHGKLQKVLTKAAPLDIVAIDILSGLPTSSDGSKYILVITDYFTKWAEAYALPDSEASTCIISLLALVCQDNYIQIKERTSKANFSQNCAN